jgi:copper chaperone
MKMTESVILTVSGMKCGGCEANVAGKLNAIDGVVSVKASSKDRQVRVEFNSEKTSLTVIKNAIAEAGFTVENPA